MHPLLLDLAPLIDRPSLLHDLRLRPERPVPPEIDRLIAAAAALGRPKAAYLLSGIDTKTDSGVVIDGAAFTSRVLRVNLDPVHRVFPYLVTAGRELDEWARTHPDTLTRFYADLIQEHILHSALHQLAERLVAAYGAGPLSSQSPGSLADWPLTQQIPLFELLGDAPAAIGVQLKPSLLMTPTKTVSGILFESETSFASCQLCPRDACPNRKAPYDPALFEQRYARPGDL